MIKGSLLLIFLTGIFFLWGCGDRLPEHVLAQVDQEMITVEQFNREFRELMLEPGKEQRGTGTDLTALEETYLDQMIERKILIHEAGRLGINVSPEELDQAVSEIKSDYAGQEFGESLGLKGMTLEQWKARLREKLLAEKIIRLNFREEKIGDKEMLQYYEANRASFQLPRRIRVRQIVVADGEEAIQILKRLKKGERFETLAAAKSLGPEKVNGGDLGFFSPGERPVDFDPLFAMEVNTVSEVIKSPYGYHIFKLEEKAGPRQIPFEEAKPLVLQKLNQKKAEQEYERWIKELRVKARVRINHQWLRS